MNEYTKIERYREMGEKYVIVEPCRKLILTHMDHSTIMFTRITNNHKARTFDSVKDAESWLESQYTITRQSPIHDVLIYSTSEGYNFAIWSKTNMIQVLQKWNKN